MTNRRRMNIGGLALGLLCAVASVAGATGAVVVDVERATDKTYVVDAAFDVDAPVEIVWAVLTDYEGIGAFVSSIRQSTIKKREPGRLILEQHGVGKAWVISLPMHVVLEVREHDRRLLAFRDLCGKSFSTYEGKWELIDNAGRTRVTYALRADPSGRQPAMLARSAIKGSVKKLLDEVREEILARAAR